MPVARDGAEPDGAEAGARLAAAGPGEGVELEQHDERGETGEEEEPRPQPGRGGHECHDEGIDDDGLKDDVQHREVGRDLVGGCAALVDHAAARDLDRLIRVK